MWAVKSLVKSHNNPKIITFFYCGICFSDFSNLLYFWKRDYWPGRLYHLRDSFGGIFFLCRTLRLRSAFQLTLHQNQLQPTSAAGSLCNWFGSGMQIVGGDAGFWWSEQLMEPSHWRHQVCQWSHPTYKVWSDVRQTPAGDWLSGRKADGTNSRPVALKSQPAQIRNYLKINAIKVRVMTSDIYWSLPALPYGNGSSCICIDLLLLYILKNGRVKKRNNRTKRICIWDTHFISSPIRCEPIQSSANINEKNVI